MQPATTNEWLRFNATDSEFLRDLHFLPTVSASESLHQRCVIRRLHPCQTKRKCRKEDDKSTRGQIVDGRKRQQSRNPTGNL